MLIGTHNYCFAALIMPSELWFLIAYEERAPVSRSVSHLAGVSTE
jgi:hypothetical protein